MKKQIILLISAIVFFSTVQAQENVTVELGVSSLNINGASSSVNVGTTPTLSVGVKVIDNVSAEFLGAWSTSSDSSVTLSNYGVYARPFVKINENFEIFGRLGINRMTLETTSDYVSTSYLAYGLGANLYFGENQKLYVQGNYMWWGKENGISLSGAGGAVGYRW
jgi:hypothetical protein